MTVCSLYRYFVLLDAHARKGLFKPPPIAERSTAMIISVSVCQSVLNYKSILHQFLHTLPITVVRFSFGDAAIRYALPVLQMTSQPEIGDAKNKGHNGCDTAASTQTDPPGDDTRLGHQIRPPC